MTTGTQPQVLKSVQCVIAIVSRHSFSSLFGSVQKHQPLCTNRINGIELSGDPVNYGLGVQCSNWELPTRWLGAP